MNLYLELSYKGTAYSGSQIQKNSITIQELLEQALKKIFNGQELRAFFAGRTDAGVHAWRQVVSVKVKKELPLKNIQAGLNSLLPAEIRVRATKYVSDDFNPRFAAREREYLYNIFLGPEVPPYLREFVWWLPKTKLDLGKMRKAAKKLKGRHDFSAFCAANSEVRHKVRTVKISSLRCQKLEDWPGSRKKPGILLTYHIKADGFLYHMVRNIISALVDIGLGKMTLAEFDIVRQSKERKKLRSITAPACGLVLYNIKY